MSDSYYGTVYYIGAKDDTKKPIFDLHHRQGQIWLTEDNAKPFLNWLDSHEPLHGKIKIHAITWEEFCKLYDQQIDEVVVDPKPGDNPGPLNVHVFRRNKFNTSHMN